MKICDGEKNDFEELEFDKNGFEKRSFFGQSEFKNMNQFLIDDYSIQKDVTSCGESEFPTLIFLPFL